MLSDKRSGRIAVVAHCILNQNSRVIGLAKRSSAIREIVELLMSNEIGILQMPCPELTYKGLSRKPQTKEHYNNVVFRKHCRKIAEEIATQILEYSKFGIKTKVVIGVEGSPSCGVTDSGILMQELHTTLKEKGIMVPFYGINHECLSGDLTKLEKLIKG